MSTDDPKSTWHPDTLALHAGYDPDPTTGSRAVPIYYTTSFEFQDAAHAARLFELKEFGNIYTRIMNPTTDVFEKRVAALEGGVAALGVASGMAAETVTLLSLMRAGDEFVTTSSLYGGSWNLFANTLPRLGITARFADSREPSTIAAAVNDKTRAIYLETVGNPRLDVPDLEAVAAIAKDAKVPLIVDNTSASPALCNPIRYGADIVIHSATKFIGGHGQAIGGVIVDAGTFAWDSGRFPEFTEPNPSYHGLKLWEAFGNLAFIIKARVEILRDIGPALSPFNAASFIQGLETLRLRMARHSDNALGLARWLQEHPKVAWVSYPGLADHPQHALAERYLEGGFGALCTFGVKAGAAAGQRLIDAVQLWSLVANIGDSRSLIIHPASTTHQQLSTEERLATGVSDDMIRLSVGLEHLPDLQADLDQALNSL